MNSVIPEGRKPRRLSPERLAIYFFLSVSVIVFLLPVYVMIVTSLKPMDEIRTGNLFALPRDPTFAAWAKAWSGACTGRVCEGIRPGMLNSFKIAIPGTLFPVILGAVNGYALSFWRFRGANLVFTLLLVSTFVPIHVFIFPLVRMMTAAGLFGTLQGIILIHTGFTLPIMTLLFRNFYAAVPEEMFSAARVDGGGFWSIFTYVLLPISTPIVIVAVILQFTGSWNDYLFGLIFAGRENQPMTVLLTSIVTSQYGEKEYNVNMAATMLSAAVPLIVYFASGRWFVRGISDGALKG
ncbi:carbohydrate ABC transporter permease (plasmid) [Agrobacterium leguminum]|uniref:ABC-type sugar transport system, permease component n=1 Tax=Agrobacterium deltaense NCPPB 1641 TaxID=1183425 RepID=A0A1S7UBA4_9HYPH|nr:MULTISPECIES: carbohydrate ABC transporter permease [Agrobacterium]WFS69778.1 carbohydrate ABC transporter permease [Agrobacterium leguminum]CVI64095.1 ABC-type sugar transport system, permease component [Agrobacterium deltaense NCPPB 1641]